MTVISVFGDRVRTARLLRRMTSSEISGKMNWASATQTRLETASSKDLILDQFEKLLKVLQVPSTFLTEPAPLNVTPSDLRFRTPKRTTKQEKDQLTAFVQVAAEFANWLDGLHRLPPVRIPRLQADHPAAGAARHLREALGVQPGAPIDHLTHRAERCGVVVIVRSKLPTNPDDWNKQGDASIERPESGEKHFGCSTWAGIYRDRPIMVLRDITSWERTRWTVAHELGHVLFHHSELPGDAEAHASKFASELLAPAQALKKELNKHVTLADLVPLKLKWGISLSALIRHLHAADLISDARRSALSRQLYTRINVGTGRTWGMDEPGYDAKKVERPRVLARWTERCLGTSAPAQVAQIRRTWPVDIIESILTTQRRAVAASPLSNGGPPLLSLHAGSGKTFNVVNLVAVRDRSQKGYSSKGQTPKNH